jgi:iron complex transport system substrate-binding protein
MKTVPVFILLSLGLSGCFHQQPPAGKDTSDSTHTGTALAKGFSIERHAGYTEITVHDPWQSAENVAFTYFLSDTLSRTSVGTGSASIRTPVHNVVCLSTTHIGYIERLDGLSSISGISGKNYVVNESLRARIISGSVEDVGYDESLNYELIVKLKPDVVFAYGVSSTVTATVQKLNELGIPVVLIAEYLEEEPLAKLEWIKVFGAFYDKGMEAAQLFDSVSATYNHLKQQAAELENRPSILLGLPWHGTWYVSGGKSYVAKLVEDAGANYLFGSLDFRDSRPLSLEKVYETALKADIWLNAGDATTLGGIDAVDERFSRLPVRIRGAVYNNNRLMGPAGGNAFYESGVVEPDVILADLISIIHPQLLPSHQLKYYKKLP